MRLAGYQLEEGNHTIYVRMKTSLPCATKEIATNQININKTPTGIIVSQKATISCFPNPFDKEINLTGLDNDKDYIINIFTTNGKLIFSNLRKRISQKSCSNPACEASVKIHPTKIYNLS